MLCMGELIEYNDNFRLYITSDLPNPHYMPEIASKITLLDFTLTEQGLRQKILSTIIAEERIDLQERKENHIVEMAKNTDLLYKLESNILEVLSSSEGNILEDENAINILSTSKSMSEEIQAKQTVAAAMENEIDTERQEYLITARHATILYRCIQRLVSINYVYQYSLNWFVTMFVQNIRETPKRHQTLSQRLKDINNNFTKRIHCKTAQTLYKKDRLAFAFLICIEMQRTQGLIHDAELEFLLTNKYSKKPYRAENNVLDFDWMSNESKHLLSKAMMLPRYLMKIICFCFKNTSILQMHFACLYSLLNINEDISNNEENWKTFCTLSNPIETMDLPEPYDCANQLQKLLIFKCLRPDAILSAIRKFICAFDGSFIENDQIDLKSAFQCSTSKTPIIYFTSTGIDATADILSLACQVHSSDR